MSTRTFHLVFAASLGFLIGVTFCMIVPRGALAAIYRPGTVEYTTAELKAAITQGPRCIHISNVTNDAYTQRFAWEYVSEGNAHLEWDRPTPAWVAARVETAFHVISERRGAGPIKGWTCARYTPAQVPA